MLARTPTTIALIAASLTNSSPVLPVPITNADFKSPKGSPAKRAADAKRKAKERLLDDGYVELPVMMCPGDYGDLIEACETYATTDVDCAGDPALIAAVEAIRADRDGWMDDPAVVGVIIVRVAARHWIEKTWTEVTNVTP